MTDMKDGQTCKVQCAEGKKAGGNIVCSNGQFTGIIMCVEDGVVLETVELMSSAFALEVDLGELDQEGILALFKAVVAKTLGVSENDVAKIDVGSSRRRLEGVRRLQAAGYEVAYQAIIPPGTDPAELASKASGIAGGASQDAFLGAMKEQGVTVDAASLKVTQAPKTMTAEIARSPDGGVLAPAPPPIPTPPPPPAPTPAPTSARTAAPTAGGTTSGTGGETGTTGGGTGGGETTEEEGGDTRAIIGGVVGGIVALLIIAGVGYFVYSKSQKGKE
jgi:hypothetical protein